jgi:hypothetical protein
MDLASDNDYRSREREYAADDFPSEELPAAPARPAKRPAAKAGRPDSRSNAAPAPAPSKSRSRQRGKRDDTDDWPSSEWDKLSDEQYWAELSADKPLATMARPAQSASNAKTFPAEPAAAKPPREERDTRAAAAAAPGSPDELARAGSVAVSRPAGLPSPEREQGRGRRERPSQQEAATERLPVRSRPQPPVPAARQAAAVPAASHFVPAGTHPSLDTGRYPVRDAGFPAAGGTGAHAVPNAGSLPTRDTGRHPSLDAGFPAPDTGRHPSLDTGFSAVPDAGRHPSLDTGPRPARDADLAMLTGLAGTPPPPVPGALEDDPLTSPSFSLLADPATDSRSYGHAKKTSRAPASVGNGSSGPAASDPLSSNGTSHAGGHDSGYPAADHASPAYTYPAEPAPVPAAPAVPAEWYSSPPVDSAPTPAYGNPYSYPEAATTGSPASHTGDPGYGGYLADPLHVYSPPSYESPVSAYPGPSGTSSPALPDPGMAAPAMGPAGGPAYPPAYPEQPYGQEQGQPDPPHYTGLHGYPPSYDSGYGGDQYAADGFGPYQP